MRTIVLTALLLQVVFSACAMNLDKQMVSVDSESPLIEFSKPSITINPLRQKIESQFTHVNNDTVGSILRSINTHTNKNTISWDCVIKDLQHDSRISYHVSPLSTTAVMGATALASTLSLYGFARDNVCNHAPTDTCLLPFAMTETFSVPVFFYLLGMLMRSSAKPHQGYQHYTGQSSDFKTLLKTIQAHKNLSQQQLRGLIADHDFSETEQQSLEYAQNSALLSDGTIHTGAFASSVRRSYPMSQMMLGCIVAAGLFTAINSVCSSFPEPIIFPDFFNVVSVAAFLPLLFTDSYTKNPDLFTFEKVIKIIEKNSEITV